MSEQINVEHAFNPEARQAQADLNAYTETRPYEDAAGRLQGEKGFINAEKHFDGLREAHEAETMPEAYENMSVTEVAKALAKAEYDADKTKVEDLSDVLVEKLSAMEDDAVSERDAEHNNDRSDNVWDRVMGVKDKELARLKAEKSPSKDELATDLQNNAVKEVNKAGDESDSIEDRGKRLRDLVKEAARIDADRIAGKSREGDKDRLNEIDEQILRELMDEYGTDDPEDPRVKKAIDFLEGQEDRLRQQTVDAEAEGKVKDPENATSQSKRRVFDVTTDPDEARAFWANELHVADEEIDLSQYGSHEGAWGIYRDIEVEPPVEEPPVVEPPVDPPTTEQPPVLLPPTPERLDRVRQPGKVKKWLGRGALALLAFAGGYTAGRGHENYIVKSHDTPSVDNINKFEDHTRDVDEDVQENMVRNYDSAEQFFKNISTKTGAKNFEKMQKRFDKEVKHYMVSEKMSKSSAEALVRAEMEQYFAHLDAQAARK